MSKKAMPSTASASASASATSKQAPSAKAASAVVIVKPPSSPSKASSSSSSTTGSKSSSAASSSRSSSGTSASSSSSGASETTERSLSDLPVGQVSEYNTGVAQAVSVYGAPSTNLGDYSTVGPTKPQADKSFASAVKQMQSAASKLGTASAIAGGKQTGRRLFLMRHGERMDRLFPEWTNVAITDQGKYVPYDMNMPLVVIDRSTLGGWRAYDDDTPLTEIGALSSQMVGRGLKSCGIEIRAIYSSPSLRCVQTASAILKGSENLDLRINLEPGLFEWMAWYDSMPKWLDANALCQAKYRVNEQYISIMSTSELASSKSESTKDYYKRIGDVIKKIMANHTGRGSVLIIGHGSTMDCGVRTLTGKSTSEISRVEMDQMGVQFPYCSIVALEEVQGAKWGVQQAVLPQLTFLGFSNRFVPDYLNRP